MADADITLILSGRRFDGRASRAHLTDRIAELELRVVDLEQQLREHRSRAVHAAGGPLQHIEDTPDFPGCRI